MPRPALQVGIDIGGTFTDFVVFWPGEGRLETFKILSTPHNPAEAVLQGVAKIVQAALARGGPAPGLTLVHGSTVATNALLERKGARTALITTRGFRDVLEIGRQNREALYNLAQARPEALVPAELRFEVDERVAADGEVLCPLDLAQLEALLPELERLGVESVAVGLLFSFLHPEHEARIAERLRAAGFPVSLSSEILPEYREYERFSTTAVNAYVSPVLDRYLAALENALPGLGAGRIPLRVMQSNGGVISPAEARREGVRCLLSGPAGGVAGSSFLAALALAAAGEDSTAQAPKLITFDMGGTSTDVSLVDGGPRMTTEAVIGGCPIRIPVLDIHTIGAGGGSIAWVDPGRALRVGPESAGAYPGPACYGRAPLEDCRPTVTDANLVLGRLAPEHFLGGEMPLDPERALYVLRRLGEQLGLGPMETALGVIEVANAHMERALQLISVERGYDPREFVLLSFGGAGGLHAAALARRLGIPKILIPPIASTLSAFGMLAADAIRDYSQTVMLPAGPEAPQLLEPVFSRLETQGLEDLQREGFEPEQIQVQRFLDMRYRGQSYELTVPWPEAGRADASYPERLVEQLLQDFHQVHRQAYGYVRPQAPVEIVTARLRAAGPAAPPALAPAPLQGPDPSPAFIERRLVRLPGGPIEVPFYRWESLQPGNVIRGAAAVVRADTTLWTGPHDEAWVDPYENLIIRVGEMPA